ncbi:hypothetical protein LCGC14_1902570, partial [marine sediment metagenome]
MANEAKLLFELEPAIPFTVSESTGIEKGTLLKMTTDQTAVISSGVQDVLAGIAASEKIADDGKIRLGVYRRGIFRLLVSGSITTGDAVSATGTANEVWIAPVLANSATILGHTLEDA